MICRIKVKLYAKSPDSAVAVRYAFDGSGVRIVTVTFTLQKMSQINMIAAELEKLINVKDVLELEFIDCPDDADFRSCIRRIFCSYVPETFMLPERGKYAVPNIKYTDGPNSMDSLDSTPEPPVIDMSKVNMQRAVRLIHTVRLHVKEHGAHPDFTAVHTEKNRKKILNYIKSACAVPSMTMDEALYIAGQLH